MQLVTVKIECFGSIRKAVSAHAAPHPSRLNALKRPLIDFPNCSQMNGKRRGPETEKNGSIRPLQRSSHDPQRGSPRERVYVIYFKGHLKLQQKHKGRAAIKRIPNKLISSLHFKYTHIQQGRAVCVKTQTSKSVTNALT